jgi:hypothetical protein
MMDWDVLSSETVYEGRFRIVKDLLRRPDGGTQEYTWLPSGNAAAVLAFDEQGRVVLTRQYRHPLGKTIMDLPAGGIHDGNRRNTLPGVSFGKKRATNRRACRSWAPSILHLAVWGPLFLSS